MGEIKKQFDNISAPSHYVKGRQYEPRKVIMDWGLNFYLGNALKYISRAGRKGSAIEDLRKAKEYIDFEIERLLTEGHYINGADIKVGELDTNYTID